MAAADRRAAKMTAGSTRMRGDGPSVRHRRASNADVNEMQRLIALVMNGAIAEIDCALETHRTYGERYD
jgi:hypothetical protein